MACAPVFIFTLIRQLSSFRAPTLWFIDLTVPTCHIQCTFLSLCRPFPREYVLQNTKILVRHFRIIRKSLSLSLSLSLSYDILIQFVSTNWAKRLTERIFFLIFFFSAILTQLACLASNVHSEQSNSSLETNLDLITVGPVAVCTVRQTDVISGFVFRVSVLVCCIAHGPPSAKWRHITVRWKGVARVTLTSQLIQTVCSVGVVLFDRTATWNWGTRKMKRGCSRQFWTKPGLF